MAQDPQQPPQDPQIIVRLHRTHKDDLVSSFLSKLSLREKLSTNKEIEEKNKEREAKTLRNRLDPVNYPDTGSDSSGKHAGLSRGLSRSLKRPKVDKRHKKT